MKYLAWIALTLLTACSPPTIKTTDGTRPGDYEITKLAIVANDEVKAGTSTVLGNQADVDEFKEYLTPALGTAFRFHGGAREAGMTVNIQSIRLETHAIRSILVGDMLRVSAIIKLWDAESGAEIGSVPVSVMGKQSQGVLGATLDGMASADDDRRAKIQLADVFAKAIIQAIYPKAKS